MGERVLIRMGFAASTLGSGSTPTSATRHFAFPSLTALREEMLGEGTEYLGIYGAEVEVDGTVEADTTVLCFPFAEQAGEGKELEAAFPVGVALLVQPLRESAVEVGVDQTLQQVIVLDRNL